MIADLRKGCGDIAERKRAEQEVRKLAIELEARVAARTDELRSANKELETFNYAVAHDLRAPLRHIHGFVDILAEEAGPGLDDSSKRHLAMIQDSVQHMGQLLEDLLSLSRMGRQELRKQSCGLNCLVDEVVTGLKPEIQNREVEWRIAELPAVNCDPALMKQVLVNLLSNALKFTRTRQPAVIEIGQTTVDSEPAIFVRDNGVGFSMKYADKLFGIFQRLHRQQDFEGTGVGLAIVQRIVNRHGGRVWAEAELNQGATFYFTLHRCQAEKKELANAHAAL
jgi:light-regulated signal transduction histidine kinase (bacteriophytochrome)